MRLSPRLDEWTTGWSRSAKVAAVLVVAWRYWPVGLALAAVLAWTGRLGRPLRGGVRLGSSGNPFDLFWQRYYRIGSSGPERDDTDAPPPPAPDEEQDFADYLERLRRARDDVRLDPGVAGRDRAGFA